MVLPITFYNHIVERLVSKFYVRQIVQLEGTLWFRGRDEDVLQAFAIILCCALSVSQQHSQ